MVQDAGSAFNTGGRGNEGVGGKNGYIYSSSCDFLVQLVRYDIFDWFPAFCWLTNTKWPNLHLAQPPGTSWMRTLKTRWSTRGENSFQRRALLWHLTPFSPLRPQACRSTLRCSQVVLTVQPSNMAATTPSSGKITRNWCYRKENTSLFALRCLYLCQMGISAGKLKLYTIDGLKYCAKNKCNTTITAPRRHKHPSSRANRSSDVAVTVNINAEFNLS